MIESGPLSFKSWTIRLGLRFIDLVQFRQQVWIFRNSLVVLLGESNHALLVDNEHRALGHALCSQTIVLRANCAMGPKIRQHGEVDPAHLFRKSFVRKRRIHTDAQHLSIAGLEFFSIPFEAA